MHEAAVFIFFIALLVSSVAGARPAFDRPLSLDDASQLIQNARLTSELPLALNDQVFAQLNRIIGTREGRDTLKQSLVRMHNFEDVVQAGLKAHNLPKDLLAIPIIESGFQNIPQRKKHGHGAGIWMFVKSTARRFGLKVDQSGDERLDVKRETDAAMRLLARLHWQFQDWGLTLLAYNAGHGFVESAIREAGSRNVFVLTKEGFENDPDYVAEVMATVVILKNRAFLD